MIHDCYKCKYRENLPGSAHSRCNVILESARAVNDEETGRQLEFAISVGAMTIGNEETGEELVKLDPHGVAKGWAAWPIDFDPTWVNECPFFTQKES